MLKNEYEGVLEPEIINVESEEWVIKIQAFRRPTRKEKNIWNKMINEIVIFSFSFIRFSFFTKLNFLVKHLNHKS